MCTLRLLRKSTNLTHSQFGNLYKYIYVICIFPFNAKLIYEIRYLLLFNFVLYSRFQIIVFMFFERHSNPYINFIQKCTTVLILLDTPYSSDIELFHIYVSKMFL